MFEITEKKEKLKRLWKKRFFNEELMTFVFLNADIRLRTTNMTFLDDQY